MFKESEESKRAKDAAFKAQQEMLQRRRNPEGMDEYMAEVYQRRAETMAAGSELKELQQRNAGGADALEDWKKLKDEGIIQASDDMERDADSERMGSDGLIASRIDENLPYIDQGYVSGDTPDLMDEAGKAFGKLFGKKE